ncbi:tungsten cofactor oxidoreductase radical SAM maturase [Proteinivorax tanatarense]|uniref:Tungsten cofactor oxidoreductase radical SAM maturase n=1 Tax=Proteinivorax tanatarense TaxID=1260629 RepID=A0AAU7VJD7_9FIRM
MNLKKVYLELTDKCNLNCKICYREAWAHRPQHMKESLLENIKQQISKVNNLDEIMLGGIGEPTYSPLFEKALWLLQDYHLTVTTNGTLLNENNIDLLSEYVDVIVISIDGLRDCYENLRGANLDKVITGIKKIDKAKRGRGSKSPHVQVQFVASRDNIDDIFGLIDLCAELNIEKLIISNLLPQDEKNADKILYTRYENKEVKQLFSRVRNYSFSKGVNLFIPNIELKTERRCNFIIEGATFITSTGQVTPCYRFAHDSKEYVFGREKNIRAKSFGDLNCSDIQAIWQSKEYTEFRNSVYNNLYPSCTDCDLVEGCDMVNDADTNCYGVSPSCSDCIWARNIVVCP